MRPESGVLPPANLAAAVSPASTISQEPDDCYFTAKAVPIRASVALSGATSTSHLSYYYHHSPATLSTGNFTNNGASPSPLLSPGASPLLSPNSARNSSAFVTPAEFPPPPGHSHPSFVFRRSQTISLASPSAAGLTPSSTVAVKSPPVDGLRVNSTSSLIWDDSSSAGLGLSLTRPPPTTGGDDGSRESTTWLSSPSLLPHPPSVNGKDAHIRPLFSAPRQSELSTTGTLGTTPGPTPGPTPPPKEYHPTLSPVTNDYFSPLAPMVTSFQPPVPQPPLPPQPTQATTTTGLLRSGKPLPLELLGVAARSGGGDSTLSPISQPPPTATSQSSLLSPISQHSPVANPTLSPLTAQTLQHLSSTALRSPSLTFIDANDEKKPMSATIGRYGSTASRPLTSTQRDRLLQLKRDYDRRQGYGQGDEEKGGRWGVRSRDGSRSSHLRTILLALGLGLLALGGIVGIIVALTVAQGGHS
ncbi:hypothetical protein G7054_g7163 [Neopestalotiopsis clavispora]|jgi:hypothetical protein|nr:hypothetical protein G7054_g7163 [Neopestalotiopsis clavispora]